MGLNGDKAESPCHNQPLKIYLAKLLFDNSERIHSKTESRDPNEAAKKFELSANLSKNDQK